MPTYQVTRRDGATAEITATSFTTDGAGTRFLGSDGKAVASFCDGVITSVIESTVAFTQPSEASE